MTRELGSGRLHRQGTYPSDRIIVVGSGTGIHSGLTYYNRILRYDF